MTPTVVVIRSQDEEIALAERIAQSNELIRRAYELLPFSTSQPVGCVQWVHSSLVQANDYNPNAVAHHEMKLLHTSVSEDGYTQPIVAMWDPNAQPWDPPPPDGAGPGRYIIVDGFHRYTVLKKYADIAQRTLSYLPVVVIDKPIADRIASTVRHNRARGKHSVTGMGNLIFEMLREGETPEEVCNKLGLEPTELARLTHVTGYSKLYGDIEFSRPVLTTAQARAKSKYAADHPDEVVPNDF